MANIIKVGTKIKYRGGFGYDPQTEVHVEYIVRSKYKRDKDGDEEVDEVPFEEREYCVFGLDNDHWCYGEQIDEIVEE